MTPPLPERLVAAIAAQDGAALARCFADHAEFRALIPNGLRERSGGSEAAALITQWFADSTELRLAASGSEQIGDRLHVFYRFEGIEEGAPYIVEQQLYCTLADGLIASATLMCSGFCPHPAK